MATALNPLPTTDCLENWTSSFDLLETLKAEDRTNEADPAPAKKAAGRASANKHNVGLSPAKLTRRDRVVLEHLPLVKAIAVRVHENLPVHVDLDDLVHAGKLGLF